VRAGGRAVGQSDVCWVAVVELAQAEGHSGHAEAAAHPRGLDEAQVLGAQLSSLHCQQHTYTIYGAQALEHGFLCAASNAHTHIHTHTYTHARTHN